MDPHPSSADVAWQSASVSATAMARGEVSSEILTARLLERIEAVETPTGERNSLNSIIAVAADALAAAKERDDERRRGHVRSALHGVAVLVKDNVEAVGLPASAGSLALAGRTVVADAPIVERMRDAGMIVVGATNLSEWANIRSTRSASGWSAVGGLTANPWSLKRSAGGSSSGSGAAVAAGLAPLAIGTETDGSINCPASLNGCVGLKPTVGRLTTRGIVPISHSQDAPGPMGRSVLDVAMLFDVLSDSDVNAKACGHRRLGDVRIGSAEEWLTGDPATDARYAAVLDQLRAGGARIERAAVLPPEAIVEDEFAVLIAELVDDLDAYLAQRPGEGVRSLADVVAFNRSESALELAYFGQELFEMALASGGTATDDYEQRRARCLEWAVDRCLEPAMSEGLDLIIAPAYAPAWVSDLERGDPHTELGGRSMTAPAIAGWPTLCLPMGFVDGLPVGLVAVARPNQEELLLAAGHAIEAEIGLVGTDALVPTFTNPR